MRLFLSRRLLFILLIIIAISITIFLFYIRIPPATKHQNQSSPKPKLKSIFQPQIKTESNEVELLLEQLFHPMTTLLQIQFSWNKLINIWKTVLFKFIHDACDLCHSNDHQCLKSVDISRYIDNINKSFYPFDKTKRLEGIGLYYNFDLKTMRSLNNSILSTDVTPCDYFHMFQLMINVQIVLHENKIDYFLTKGTFIGSLRHHDVIPWDTDIDLFIPYSSVLKFTDSFKHLNIFTEKNSINAANESKDTYDEPLLRKDLFVYQYRNVHRVTSYKIFSIRSPRVNRAYYRWPKIDVFPYQQSHTHIFAYPRHKHNLGTMNYLAKTDVYPPHLRPLGPLLVPSPRNLRRSLKAMVLLGQASVFRVCEGNTFLHRQNQVSSETWRVPCRALVTSYPFVKSEHNSTNDICTEMLLFNNQSKPLSLFKYKCDEELQRTIK